MTNSTQKKVEAYELADEFSFEDLVMALKTAGVPTKDEIRKWRAEEAQRKAAYKRRSGVKQFAVG